MPISTRLIVYLGMKGSVIALDRRTGSEQWRTRLKGSGFVNCALDGDLLLATSHGEIFGLDARTGRILWNNPLKGMGYGLITISGTNIAPMEQQRADEAANSSAGSVPATM